MRSDQQNATVLLQTIAVAKNQDSVDQPQNILGVRSDERSDSLGVLDCKATSPNSPRDNLLEAKVTTSDS